jgi:hypothetical protein
MCYSKTVEEIGEDSVAVLSYAKSQEMQPQSMTEREKEKGAYRETWTVDSTKEKV